MSSLASFIPIIGPAVEKILDLIPDPNAKAKAQAEYDQALLDAQRQAEADQREINKIEAASSSWWVSGWRPGVGWVCVVSLAMYYIPRFALGMGFWCWACVQAGGLVPLPELGVSEVVGLVLSLLGMGTLRTFEKAKGVAK